MARKQTLYLLASGILMLLLTFFPFAEIMIPSGGYTLTALGYEHITGELTFPEHITGELTFPNWFLFSLNVLIVLLSFIAIFIYKDNKRRVIQRRMTVFNLFLKVGFIVLVWIQTSYMTGMLTDDGTEWQFSIRWLASFPIIAMILDYLAARAIAIDEATIRSIHRLRG